MIACAVVAILTTLGIVVSLLFEAFRFFDRIPLSEFLFGLNWEPQIAIRADQAAGQGAFGAVPVFLGPLVIALDRKSVVSGKSVSVRVDLGGRRNIKKKRMIIRTELT